MMLMGDEIRRTQGGNNNAYCYDNANNWMDWGWRNTPMYTLRKTAYCARLT
jgi:glycogen operon protein